MTALQNTFNSSTILYSTSAVQSQSGSNAKLQTDPQQIKINTETLSDIVAISAEGLEAYQKIENAQLDLQQQSIDFESMIVTMPKGSGELILSVEEHSKHLSVVAWALEIDVTESYKEIGGLSFINKR
jgi:CelD/BcsL family acetyltransferase involved in cellulose biosynthesis